MHRHGTWPARRCGPSSASRAKHHTGARPSAQTLGRKEAAERQSPAAKSNCNPSFALVETSGQHDEEGMRVRRRPCREEQNRSRLSSVSNAVFAQAARLAAGGSPSPACPKDRMFPGKSPSGVRRQHAGADECPASDLCSVRRGWQNGQLQRLTNEPGLRCGSCPRATEVTQTSTTVPREPIAA